MTQRILEQKSIMEQLLRELNSCYGKGQIPSYEQIKAKVPEIERKEYDFVVDSYIAYNRKQELAGIDEYDNTLKSTLPFLEEHNLPSVEYLDLEIMRMVSAVVRARESLVVKAASTKYKEKYAALLEENEKLRKENEALRAQLAASSNNPQGSPFDANSGAAVNGAKGSSCAVNGASNSSAASLDLANPNELNASLANDAANGAKASAAMSQVNSAMQGNALNQAMGNMANNAMAQGYANSLMQGTLPNGYPNNMAQFANMSMMANNMFSPQQLAQMAKAGMPFGVMPNATEGMVNPNDPHAMAQLAAFFNANGMMPVNGMINPALNANGSASGADAANGAMGVAGANVNAVNMQGFMAPGMNPMAMFGMGNMPAHANEAGSTDAAMANSSSVHAAVTGAAASVHSAASSSADQDPSHFSQILSKMQEHALADSSDSEKAMHEEYKNSQMRAAVDAVNAFQASAAAAQAAKGAKYGFVGEAMTPEAVDKANKMFDALATLKESVFKDKAPTDLTSDEFESLVAKAIEQNLFPPEKSEQCRRICVKLVFQGRNALNYNDLEANDDVIVASIPDQMQQQFARGVLAWGKTRQYLSKYAVDEDPIKTSSSTNIFVSMPNNGSSSTKANGGASNAADYPTQPLDENSAPVLHALDNEAASFNALNASLNQGAVDPTAYSNAMNSSTFASNAISGNTMAMSAAALMGSGLSAAGLSGEQSVNSLFGVNGVVAPNEQGSLTPNGEESASLHVGAPLGVNLNEGLGNSVVSTMLNENADAFGANTEAFSTNSNAFSANAPFAANIPLSTAALNSHTLDDLKLSQDGGVITKDEASTGKLDLNRNESRLGPEISSFNSLATNSLAANESLASEGVASKDIANEFLANDGVANEFAANKETSSGEATSSNALSNLPSGSLPSEDSVALASDDTGANDDAFSGNMQDGDSCPVPNATALAAMAAMEEQFYKLSMREERGIPSHYADGENKVHVIDSSRMRAIPRDEETLIKEMSGEMGDDSVKAVAEATAKLEHLVPLLNEAGREFSKVKKQLDATLDPKDSSIKDKALLETKESSLKEDAESNDKKVSSLFGTGSKGFGFVSHDKPTNDKAEDSAKDNSDKSDENGENTTAASEIYSVANDVVALADELDRSYDNISVKKSIFENSFTPDIAEKIKAKSKPSIFDSPQAFGTLKSREAEASEQESDDTDDFFTGSYEVDDNYGIDKDKNKDKKKIRAVDLMGGIEDKQLPIGDEILHSGPTHTTTLLSSNSSKITSTSSLSDVKVEEKVSVSSNERESEPSEAPNLSTSIESMPGGTIVSSTVVASPSTAESSESSLSGHASANDDDFDDDDFFTGNTELDDEAVHGLMDSISSPLIEATEVVDLEPEIAGPKFVSGGLPICEDGAPVRKPHKQDSDTKDAVSHEALESSSVEQGHDDKHALDKFSGLEGDANKDERHHVKVLSDPDAEPAKGEYDAHAAEMAKSASTGNTAVTYNPNGVVVEIEDIEDEDDVDEAYAEVMSDYTNIIRSPLHPKHDKTHDSDKAEKSTKASLEEESKSSTNSAPTSSSNANATTTTTNNDTTSPSNATNLSATTNESSSHSSSESSGSSSSTTENKSSESSSDAKSNSSSSDHKSSSSSSEPLPKVSLESSSSLGEASNTQESSSKTADEEKTESSQVVSEHSSKHEDDDMGLRIEPVRSSSHTKSGKINFSSGPNTSFDPDK